MRTWCYGAKKGPTTNVALVRQQIERAHRYYNTLIGLEQDARNVLKTLKPDDEAGRAALKESLGQKRRDARRDRGGVYDGTYLQVEASVRQAVQTTAFNEPLKPRFWDGTGMIAIQVKGGLTVEDCFRGDDTRVRITGHGKHRQLHIRISTVEGKKDPIWSIIPFVYHRPMPASEIAWVRVVCKKVATHLQYEVQFILQADVTLPAPIPKTKFGIDVGWRRVEGGMRVAAWAAKRAYAPGSGWSGNEYSQGVLVVPDEILQRWEKVEDLVSIRKKNFNQTRDWLSQCLRGGVVPVTMLQATRDGKHHATVTPAPGLREGDQGEPDLTDGDNSIVLWPQWLLQATSHLHQWESSERLTGLTLRWRHERFDGDKDVYERLEAWRKQDKHLYEWEDHQRKNVLRARRELYRVFAKQVTARYETVVIENLDLRDFAELPEKDEPKEAFSITASRVRRFKANLSELLGCIVDAVKRAGGTVIEVEAAYTTRRCAECFHEAPEAIIALEHTCTACGAHWDQDLNAAKNLLMAETPKTSKRTKRKDPAEETDAQAWRRKGLETRRAKRDAGTAASTP